MEKYETALGALGPLDGRYREQLTDLAPVMSEGGLITTRLRVEAAWLLHLGDVPAIARTLKLTQPIKEFLDGLSRGTIKPEPYRVKAIEKTTNHDVKAVEYHLREMLIERGADSHVLPFVHFACTSEDVNNISYALMLEEARSRHMLPLMDLIVADLKAKAGRYAGLAMLARTHGQSATPTTMGKEMAVFGHRLARQRDQFASIQLEGKINGAVGNYNAHLVSYPEVDWMQVTRSFIEHRLAGGIKQNPLTTQIENHDSIVEYLDALRRFNVILLGLTRDVWGYVSLGYFQQKLRDSEVGSSTMPHKVNPIDFENAEGNLGLATAMAQHFAEKLPISRWQRDLSDSTVQRNFGTILGYSVLAYKSTLKGMAKVSVAEDKITADLSGAWEVLAEAVQTVMRRYGVSDAYERLKQSTRGRAVTREVIHELINNCPELPKEAKKELTGLSPAEYTGYAARLAAEYSASR